MSTNDTIFEAPLGDPLENPKPWWPHSLRNIENFSTWISKNNTLRGGALTSSLLVNSFIMDVYEKMFLKFSYSFLITSFCRYLMYVETL